MNLVASKPIGKKEFIVLMALMTSIIALAIDSMLPALPNIGAEFSAPEEKLPLIISILFLGFGFGQLVFGPLSDVYGRKTPIYIGITFFLLGTLMAYFATNMPMLLVGRVLQGFGGAAPRIVSIALIRDKYSGDAMAQITSLVMTIFILVPAIAPSIGQVILYFTDWRSIFTMLFVFALMALIWFFLRQNETLAKKNRKKFSLKQIFLDIKKTFSYPTTVACMLVSGMVFGVFIGYLGAIQSIFDKIFGVAHLFPMFFAVLALSVGGASFFNSKMVLALGMRRLIVMAFLAMALISNVFAVYLAAFQVGVPPLWLFMTYMMLTFFSVGFLFGNLNAMAMEPLGHIAGIGSAILAFVQSTIGVVIGSFLATYFQGSVEPLVMSFGTISLLCLIVLFFEKRFRKSLTV